MRMIVVAASLLFVATLHSTALAVTPAEATAKVSDSNEATYTVIGRQEVINGAMAEFLATYAPEFLEPAERAEVDEAIEMSNNYSTWAGIAIAAAYSRNDDANEKLIDEDWDGAYNDAVDAIGYAAYADGQLDLAASYGAFAVNTYIFYMTH